MSEHTLQMLYATVLHLLRPLVRILLRNGVPFGTFSDLAKWVYVDLAALECGIPGRKQTNSRISVITGLSRKEVLRVRRLPRPDDSALTDRYNRAARVVSGWIRDQRFTDEKGVPLDLPLESANEPSFTFLVKQHSGDVPVRAILDELMRVNAVQNLDDGRIHLVERAYIPGGGEAEMLNILGTDAADLITTIDHNLRCAPGEARFQRKVAYDNLPVEVLPELRALSRERAQALLEDLNKWLADRDRDINPSVQGSGRLRAGVGIYFFEEQVPEDQ